MQTIDMKVLGGLPITVGFTTTGYDNRDVGLGVNDIDEWWIEAINGKKAKKCDWLYKRIREADEESLIIEKCSNNR